MDEKKDGSWVKGQNHSVTEMEHTELSNETTKLPYLYQEPPHTTNFE